MSTFPPYRRLRVYTFDPSLATKIDTALINEVHLNVPWEKELKPGPEGDYLEVVDFDPASDCFYAPVDLNESRLLAQDGLAPSEGNPQFHQQMVYAVAMTTIQNFERALGRLSLWATQRVKNPRPGSPPFEPVLKLRIYPHALREANAYYSPEKKALLFGYFPAVLANPGELLPGGLVFTCLSYDVVAHETTHALLDGLHRYFAEPSNPDVLAFHEAFADIVALFQHFSHAEALRHQIARTRGDLASQNLLGALAHQFGQAIGNRGALRDAIGEFREEGDERKWIQKVPTPEDYANATEAHDRGAVLVAAMFDAFLAIYRRRIADLLRIATGGTGVLPQGELHPDLVNRLANEASKTATHILRMAIRALDYCPPVDMTFGDYLRAMITGDTDLMPEDPLGYRLAVIEAFRRRGIYPRDVRTLAPDALLWSGPGWKDDKKHRVFGDLIEKLKELTPNLEWQTTSARKDINQLNQQYQKQVHDWLCQLLKARPDIAAELGVARCWTDGRGRPLHSISVGGDGLPAFEVHSVRSTRRQLQNGRTRVELVIEITQRRFGYRDEDVQELADRLPPQILREIASRDHNETTDGQKAEVKRVLGEMDREKAAAGPKPGEEAAAPPQEDVDRRLESLRRYFVMRGGCTLLINSETGEVRYCISKNVASSTRLTRLRAHAGKGSSSRTALRATYLPNERDGLIAREREPFAFLHRMG